MSLRDEMFARFGPKLMEVLFEMWLEELNEIRMAIGKQPLTKEYVLGRCHNNINHLEDYDWMNDS